MFLRSAIKRSFGTQKATLPTLAYGYGDLAPVISADILELHHGKHHQTYVNKYNEATEKLEAALKKGDHHMVSDLCKQVRFNGGGHVNHALYWENLAPINKHGGDLPAKNSELSKSIIQAWGSYENMMKEFNTKAAEVQGSGWCWLAYCQKTKQLCIRETKDQFIISAEGPVPLLTVDVWEHAYYLQYKNQRPDYLKKIWEIINWKVVEKRFNEAPNQPEHK